jgi:hypothetical protein
MFYYSRGRVGDHPRDHLAGCAEIMQADAVSGFYESGFGRRIADRTIENLVEPLSWNWKPIAAELAA